MGRRKRYAAERKRRWITLAAGLTVLAAVAGLFRVAAAKTYTITDGQRVLTYTTFATDPGQILGEAGLELSGEDSYFAGGSDIQISRAQRITVRHYGREVILPSAGETLGELLSFWDLLPEPGDRVSHSLDIHTWDGMEVRIDGIRQRTETYTDSVPHETIYCYDATLEAGTQRVLVGGVDGEVLRTARVTYTNARETGREILTETMTQAPVTQIVAVGTGQPPQEPKKDDMPIIRDGYILLPTGEVLTYYRSDTVRATAYTHTDAGCDYITYTGTRVHVGTVAVDPRFIPYGTRMFIVSDDGEYIYGIAVAEDCGGAIKRDRVDLYFPTYQECIQFGRRTCTVYFLG